MRKKIIEFYPNIDKNCSDESILEFLMEILPMVPDEDYIINYNFIKFLKKSIEVRIVKNREKLINEILR